MAQYQKPPAMMTRFVNPALVYAIQKLGFRGAGLAVLEVEGRKTGRLNKVPVQPVEVDGVLYLVSPRGSTQWARNLRAMGSANLSIGRDRQRIVATEIPDSEKIPVLREYLRRFSSSAGKIMGAGKNATDFQLQSIVANHPVFRITR